MDGSMGGEEVEHSERAERKWEKRREIPALFVVVEILNLSSYTQNWMKVLLLPPGAPVQIQNYVMFLLKSDAYWSEDWSCLINNMKHFEIELGTDFTFNCQLYLIHWTNPKAIFE